MCLSRARDTATGATDCVSRHTRIIIRGTRGTTNSGEEVEGGRENKRDNYLFVTEKRLSCFMLTKAGEEFPELHAPPEEYKLRGKRNDATRKRVKTITKHARCISGAVGAATSVFWRGCATHTASARPGRRRHAGSMAGRGGVRPMRPLPPSPSPTCVACTCEPILAAKREGCGDTSRARNLSLVRPRICENDRRGGGPRFISRDGPPSPLPRRDAPARLATSLVVR